MSTTRWSVVKVAFIGCAIAGICGFGAGRQAGAEEAPPLSVQESTGLTDAQVDALLQRRGEEFKPPVNAGYRGGFFIRSNDDLFSVRINGRIQARYEFLDRPNNDNLSSFYLRRVRLDFRGNVFDKNLTYRIMPELNRNATMRDAYINYAFAQSRQIMVGQQTVRFQRQREISSTRNHFAERSQPSELFGVPSGYDIGVSLHGINPDRTMTYSVGIYDGSGRNTQQSNSDGHLVSGRVYRALLGTVPTDETDFRASADPNLAIGLGLQAANKNESRNWALGRSANNMADYGAVTADIQFTWRGLSLAADGYLRSVNPDDCAVSSYTGDAYLVTAGYALIPDFLEIVGRYSELRLDRKDSDTRQTETGVGATIYHFGHNVKTRLNYLNREDNNGRTGIYIAELGLAF